MEAIGPSEMSALTRGTQRNIPDVGILHSHRNENVKSYIYDGRLGCEYNAPSMEGADL
jgi:hypothetical protein